MELSAQILSDITIYMKYARYLPEKRRRETWKEIIDRNKQMHIKKFPNLREEIENAYQFVYKKEIFPSMRSLQFGGKPIEISPNRQFNCCFCAVDDWRVFSEIMFLLLGGTGVGYSVQRHHVEQLPEIVKPSRKRTKRFLIGDSIEGWADAVKALMKSYFFGTSKLKFDFSDIREKGAPLITSGGKAPGPQPLKDCIHNIKKILDAKEIGDKLTSLEAHDLICHIADAVLAGGIRRAALISLFSFDDEEMLACKSGSWWELNPQRGRANNSAVILRHMITESEFAKFWERIKASGCGEPGIFFTNDKELGTNPCAEISLKSFGFCNLTTINISNVHTQEEFNARVKAAAFIGTLQAAYTDFHYLRDNWKKNTEKEALLGVSMTGIASRGALELNFREAANVVVEENRRVARLLGIKPAARTTCVKPEGTASLVAGTSSGIHSWFSEYYIRRIRVGKNEAIYKYLKSKFPFFVEDDYFKPSLQAVVSIPVKSPDGAILREGESALDLLARVKKINSEWVRTGHQSGQNAHNVSSTVSIKNDVEWEAVGKWMWENREFYNGLTVLPFDGGIYKQAPFEACSKEQYESMILSIKSIDLSEVIEDEDNTELKEQVACAGGQCELAF